MAESPKITVRDAEDNAAEEIGDMEFKEKAPARDGLTETHIMAYSVGHFQNDLCASMWFVYLVYYLQYVVHLPATIAASAQLSGQIADGITTPLVGVLSDSINCPGGKRNTWYYMGSLLVLPSFFCIFFRTPKFLVPDSTGETLWYCILPAVFNVGWASVQIASMSIVNQLSYSQRRRDRMVNNRNGFTYAANITVLSLALILTFSLDSNVEVFSILCISMLCLGSCTSIFYVCKIRENSLSAKATALEEAYRQSIAGNDPNASNSGAHLNTSNDTKTDEKKKESGTKWWDWLKKGQFYIFGLVYMFARIALNTTATITPFYISVVLGYGKPEDPTFIPYQVSSVPLVTYTCSLLWSTFAQARLTQRLRNRLYMMIIATIFELAGSIPLLFIGGKSNGVQQLVYPCAGLQGIGIAILLNTGTSLISDVVGKDSSSSAFVYGFYSLLDKFANGFMLFYLVAAYSDNGQALKIIIAAVPSLAALGTLLCTWVGMVMYSDQLAKISQGSQLKKGGGEETDAVEKRLLAEAEVQEIRMSTGGDNQIIDINMTRSNIMDNNNGSQIRQSQYQDI